MPSAWRVADGQPIGRGWRELELDPRPATGPGPDDSGPRPRRPGGRLAVQPARRRWPPRSVPGAVRSRRPPSVPRRRPDCAAPRGSGDSRANPGPGPPSPARSVAGIPELAPLNGHRLAATPVGLYRQRRPAASSPWVAAPASPIRRGGGDDVGAPKRPTGDPPASGTFAPVDAPPDWDARALTPPPPLGYLQPPHGVARAAPEPGSSQRRHLSSVGRATVS